MADASEKPEFPTDTMKRIHDELLDAQADFSNADADYKNASLNRTSALNRLNAAQKAFDKLIGEIKAAAPEQTDWAPRQRGEI